MTPHDNSTFTLLDREFFVSMEERTPGPELSSIVAEVLGDAPWTVTRGGVWTHVQPEGWDGPAQGWKLHLSATPANAGEVLRRAAAVLRDHGAYFKFASDVRMLYVILSKNWPREGGGKFITVYPRDEGHFRRIGQDLAAATNALDGPYILSDRRVPGSRVVFYRYGQHQPVQAVNARGHRMQQMLTPGGTAVEDARTGYYQQPDWVEDPFGSRSVRPNPGERKITLNGRFEVQGPLKYSNTGGLYLARDLKTDHTVVIREARPCTGWVDERTDAVALLRKEARILRAMDASGWVPDFVDQFQAWEHHYLAQEEVRGALLREYVLSRYLLSRSVASPRRLFWTLRGLLLNLVAGLEAFHRNGIIVRDLTASNVLVRRDGSLCFIDFEYAWEKDGSETAARGIHTPGYASPEQMTGQAPCESDDWHALGAVVVEMCSLMAGGLALNGPGVLDVAGMMMDEVGLPRELLAVARGLMAPNPDARWRGDEVRKALGGIRAVAVPWTAREPARQPQVGLTAATVPALSEMGPRIADTCEAVCHFLERSANPRRRVLWPASPHAYQANPVCIQYGACGPIEYVRRVRGKVPAAWLDWVQERADPSRVPPGLHVGLAGIALTLGLCGRDDAAVDLLRTAAESPLLGLEADLFHGAAGVGVAALTLAAALDRPALHDLAVRIGAGLRERAESRRHGIAWRDADGVIPCGLARGASGIALFYTYLGAATGDIGAWEIARQALRFEISQVRRRSGYDFWPAEGATRRRRAHSPHVYFGAAGVGTAAIRLYMCTAAPELREWSERCARTATFRWTNKLWQDYGYAGLGETLLDMHAGTGVPAYRANALRMAEILLATRVETRFGTAFPGGALNRVASDFGVGASGIALFLRRVLHPGEERAFLPDRLLSRLSPSGAGAEPARAA